MAEILSGKDIAPQIRAKIRKTVDDLAAKGLPIPTLKVILAGDDPASASYVKGKEKACQEAGIRVETIKFPENVSRETLIETITALNKDPDTDGILLQLPLPKGLADRELLALIDPLKDVDGFHPVNVGKLYLGETGMVPCTPLGVMELLKHTNVNLTGKHAVVVGRSMLVGTPAAKLLLNQNATVTICHSKTQDLGAVIRQADVVVAAVGVPQLIKGDWIKEGAIVIDVGINRQADGKLTGDVEFSEAVKHASWITPVPGGVGPMTVAMLLKNTLTAYYNRRTNGIRTA
ncbi:MAG: bifunctional methylenetetrahydrofolate dehydrogenase/methenyltetrahydrofolate cyclohydrolase FolD [Erysipelotrichaceae bacterium]|jgi:methylenetetrahydrofolate dehydrogenase (NADP+)/methenyltetrahydrofolate cyclohydrolase|nr:bifunctional methylenetetrahydrofolate dehydrogenase/methenyltetrahydrofolate cyclohydrolase FolD [Erysipelotrichaceae bacterium]